jgi:anaerobic selenocysteine-containing dehydrogenase
VAQAQPARRGWGFGEKLRVRGFASTAAGLPTAALAEEILKEGEGQIRALFCIGSNPVAAWPDQLKALEAIQKLDLCVTLDMKMSATSRHADYVIAPKLSFEVPGVSLQMEALEQTYVSMGYPSAYAQYAPALVDSPEGSDVLEEWEFFYGLAKRMGQGMSLYPLRPESGVLREKRGTVEVDMVNKPSSDELLAMLTEGSRIPLDEVKKHPHGAVFDGEPVLTAAKEPGWEGRLELADATMLRELEEIRAETIDRAAEEAVFPFRLVSRRLPNAYNSSGRDLPSFTRKRTYNPAFMNPEDLDALGLEPGAVVRIASNHAAILGVVEAEPELRRGVVSMSHAFGDAPDRDGDFMKIGSSTGRLMNAALDYDPYSGIPRMSAIPVVIEPFERDDGEVGSPA